MALAKFVRQGANVNYVDAFQTTSIMRGALNPLNEKIKIYNITNFKL